MAASYLSYAAFFYSLRLAYLLIYLVIIYNQVFIPSVMARRIDYYIHLFRPGGFVIVHRSRRGNAMHRRILPILFCLLLFWHASKYTV